MQTIFANKAAKTNNVPTSSEARATVKATRNHRKKRAARTRAAKASEKTMALIEKLDSKINDRNGYASNRLGEWIAVLFKTGRVEVGWRESCGCTDKTHKIFREWLKVVKALKRDGLCLAEERVRHKNGNPTRSGGFWSSIIYSVET